MSRYRASRRARSDLDEIWRFIAVDSIETADRFVDEITSKFPLIAQFPGIGADRSDLGSGLRTLPVGKYLIIYRSTPRPVQIVRVIHGARDLTKLFPPKQ